jgi:hypothetical protein
MSDQHLERRDLLRLAAGALAAGAQSACASPARLPAEAPSSAADVAAELDPAAADATLARLDERMTSLAHATLPEDILPLSKSTRTPAHDAELAASQALVRKSVRSLYLTGRFLDLPDAIKMHPGMQSRLRAIQPEMDDAVLGMTSRLERMTPDDHKRVQSFLANDPDFGERLAHMLEKTAVDDGLAFKRSFGVRATTLQLSQRMASQSPALVVDPIVRKVRRIEARPRSDAEMARRGAARVGEAAFWAHQDRMAMLQDAWRARLGTAVASAGSAWPQGSSSDSAPPPWPAVHEGAVAPMPSAEVTKPTTPGQRTVSTGGITMGFGLGSVAFGAILGGIAAATGTTSVALVGPALFFGVTLGPILLVVGLIIVIVGAFIELGE